MDSVFCCRSKKGMVFLADNKKQVIYNFQDNIIATDGPDQGLVDILGNAGPSVKKTKVKQFLNINHHGECDLLLGYSHRGFNLYVFNSSSQAFSEIEDFGYLSDSKKKIKAGLRRIIDLGFDLSKCKTLDQMLEFLYRLTQDGRGHYQFGFIDRYGSKALYSPSVELLVAPAEYEARGRKGQRKSEIDTGFYNALVKSLGKSSQFIEAFPGFFQRSSILNLKKRKHNRKLSQARKDTADIIARYMDYEHGLIERFTIRNYLREKETSEHIGFAPRFLDRKRHNLQKSLEKEYLPSDVRSVVLKHKEGNPKLIQDSLYHLENELGMLVRPFLNIPCLSLRGDVKEINKFFSYIDARRFSKFSMRCNKVFNSIDMIEYSHGVFLPELIHAFINGKDDIVIPISPYISEYWNQKMIGSPEANRITTGNGVNVAVEDTGVDYRHKELRGNFDLNKLGYDFVNNNDKPKDYQGHGTHVAGTIAGDSTGVAKDCRLYSVRVLNERGSGLLDDILLGIDWCISNDIDVINLSLGSPKTSKIEQDMFEMAYKKGLICVAAAGNSYYGPHYPAAYETVIAVAAVDRSKKHAPFSNIYRTNNVSAPGVGIISTLPGGDYGSNTGTSMAAPHISGVCALIASQEDVNKDSALRLIENTAERLGNPNDTDNWAKFGCGLVQAHKAVGYKVRRWRRSA